MPVTFSMVRCVRAIMFKVRSIVFVMSVDFKVMVGVLVMFKVVVLSVMFGAKMMGVMFRFRIR